MNKRRSLAVIISVVTICAWGVMMFFLAAREGLIERPGKERMFREILPGDIRLDNWKGIYVNGKFIGYSSTRISPASKGHLIESSYFLKFRLFDSFQELAVTTVQELDDTHRVESFETKVTGLTDISLKGHRSSGQMVMDISFAGNTHRKSFPLSDDLILDQSILQTYRGTDLSVGDRYSMRIFNPLTLSMEEAVTEVTDKEDDLFIMETRFGDLISRSWVDRNGLVLREQLPNGWEMKLEDREAIEKKLARIETDTVDLISDLAVRAVFPGRDPHSARFMRIRVSGINLDNFTIENERQNITDKKAGIIEIRTVTPEPDGIPSLPITIEDMKPFLLPSLWIASDDPSIAALAEEIVGNERNSWQAAQKIASWVYREIEKAVTPEFPSAPMVLKTRRGDCNEHTVLFTALARAAGVPAQMCAGLVYTEGGFYYHAWPKVYVGTWIHMDPTLGQHVADATHIELISGDFPDQSAIVLAIGRISIDILDASREYSLLDGDWREGPVQCQLRKERNLN